MPSWLTELMTIQTFGVAAVLVFLGWLAMKAWPLVRKLSHFVDDVAGEPARDGVPERPGLMKRLAEVEAKVDVIHHETRPNGGGSMNDAVRRIERTQSEDGQTLARHIAETGIFLPMLRDLHQRYVSLQPPEQPPPVPPARET